MKSNIKGATIKAWQTESVNLEKINAFTLRPLTAEEVFAFKVVASSNEVDRDFESFTPKALEQMAALYVGKSMILDHLPTANGQVARVYDAEVLTDETKTTTLGETHTALVLYVFLPRIQKNEGLISEIECGIKKEVSVGVCVQKRICSVCGEEMRGCTCKNGHRLGTAYDDALCVVRLDEAVDAYELSFVAVPSLREAGTTKASQQRENEPQNPQQKQENTVLNGFLKFLKN